MRDGFIKAAAASPRVVLADPAQNALEIIGLARRAAALGVKLCVFPELSLTGVSCGDLFMQKALLDEAEEALFLVLNGTSELGMLLVVGLPLRCDGKVFSCAALMCGGELVGVVPKTCVPADERRWFSTDSDSSRGHVLSLTQPDGDILYIPLARNVYGVGGVEGLCLGVELGDEPFDPGDVSGRLCRLGATVLINPAAPRALAGGDEKRRQMLLGQSAQYVCGVIRAGAGAGESSTDGVFSGQCVICENGELLAETSMEPGLAVSELDMDRLTFERRRISGFGCGEGAALFCTLPQRETGLTRHISPTPFVPEAREELARRCREVLAIQTAALCERAAHTGAQCLVVGVSGGLDSALALTVAQDAAKKLGISAVAVTMPCFGTSGRTRSNAEALALALGARFRTVDISESVLAHLGDIGHAEDNHDAAYENAQSRERTQVLMDIANAENGLVVGTGDMSELALGWTTYNGDQMSMYGVNAGVPKTLVRAVVLYLAGTRGGTVGEILRDIAETPISPELLPGGQMTEELIGPYELHDFFLFHMLRYGAGPGKLLRLAEYAFKGRFKRSELLQWLRVFLTRFFSQQFKRSAMPDGPCVVDISLSPRDGLRMPSDACAGLWLRRLDELC